MMGDTASHEHAVWLSSTQTGPPCHGDEYGALTNFGFLRTRSAAAHSVAILFRPHVDRVQSRRTTVPDRVCVQGHHLVRSHLARHPRSRRFGRHYSEEGPRQTPRPGFDHPHLFHHPFHRLRHDRTDSRRHVSSSASAVRSVPVPVQVRLRDHARLARQADRQHQPGLHATRRHATTRDLHDHCRRRP
ncbi:hypothetical protein BMF94_3179 [Rhodotorula taiwanensis]|uniref:Uncharacterized protein n=1 Tax=Rhodotorula taiwanensis TaxID=741276 RepID=A0A2S5BA51_9BASI|nr:hypothetical protein BMF94_3179 [Rhodotorula taiwanensis]